MRVGFRRMNRARLILGLLALLGLPSASAPRAAVHQAGSPWPALRDTIGGEVAGVEDSIVCRIAPYCSHLWPEDLPRFHVTLENRSSRPVFFVVPPRLCSVRRIPEVTGWITDAEGRPCSSAWGCFDPEWTTMTREDFVAVRPGKRLDLYGAHGYVEPGWRKGVRPGRYLEHFEYSTTENDLRQWLGEYPSDSLGADWRAQFRHVPRVDLHAECWIEVQQR